MPPKAPGAPKPLRDRIACQKCGNEYFAKGFDPAGACEHIRADESNAKLVEGTLR